VPTGVFKRLRFIASNPRVGRRTAVPPMIKPSPMEDAMNGWALRS